MAEIDNIVQITLTKASTPVATASFQIPLVLSQFTNFSERYRAYTDMEEVAEDFDSTQAAYKIAAQLFGQTTVGARPASVLIGRRQINTITLNPVVADNEDYTVTINGTDYTFNSGGSATATSIGAGLDTAVGSLTGINFTSVAGVITVGVSTPGTAWSFAASENLTQTVTTPTETWVEAKDAVEQENDTWYALIAETHVQADVVALANSIQASRKIFGTSSSDVVIPTNGTSDIAYVLDAQSASRTFGIYLPTADTQYPEAAWIGAQLSYTPGSNDWDYKRVTGVTVSNLSATQRVNLRNKNMNMYTTVHGVDIMQDGNMFDGAPIDEAIFIDWLYARLQEGIFFRIINSLKIPMTNTGLAIVEAEIRAVLAQAEANGGIDAGWTVTVPDVLDIPANLRAQRTAGNFVFKARLAGSVRRVVISGFLSV